MTQQNRNYNRIYFNLLFMEYKYGLDFDVKTRSEKSCGTVPLKEECTNGNKEYPFSFFYILQCIF